jgi:hypothetical protein
VLDTIETLDRTDVPEELLLSIAGGLSLEASAPDVCGRLAVAVEDNVDVTDAVDGRRARLIFGVARFAGFAPTFDAVDAPDVRRDSVE